MSLVMSQQGMDRFLEEISNNQNFECKVWGTINTPNYIGGALGGALSNIYSYFGICDNNIYIACVKNTNVDEMIAQHKIPCNIIKKINIRNGIFGRTIYIVYDDKANKLKFTITNSAPFTNIKNQKENALKFKETLNGLKNKKI